MMTGNSLSIMANRISYNLDVRGPSLTVDTACSSSLVALTLAAEAIRNGKIDTAIVAGVNLLLSPLSYVGFSRASMLSPTDSPPRTIEPPSGRRWATTLRWLPTASPCSWRK